MQEAKNKHTSVPPLRLLVSLDATKPMAGVPNPFRGLLPGAFRASRELGT